ncbi:2-C-methyl-D-erythritol 4-phosphate cytidylyltransferase [Neomicrococcus aestuarii]|uniref:2-C-methyl-D-erythritol 4-phosphate cytidylyltransferase n=1 Tax=Neomicrococcus aestuarii TaxID=556325 RepID=A0A7W8TT21_9MICC|nr:2-C-methyl-D-erythritol 4-phosphate cytidylyltransferase [Neomicrococcus aestuarii]MBB5512366.1 2-C-methyl-D-erythritol 4-phosphate cytidylyltransferase [Neomicrococcus aestuarii]
MTDQPIPPAPETPARIAVIMVAAGQGTRLGYGIPKAEVPIGEHTMLETALRSADAFLRREDVRLIAVLPPQRPDFRRLIENFAREHHYRLSVTEGGATRTESVLNGVRLAEGAQNVLVHDAARPLASSSLFERVLASLDDGEDAVIPGLPVVDTTKRVSIAGIVEETVDRSVLRAIQTPQGFAREALVAAYAVLEGWSTQQREAATDEAMLFELLGKPVRVIDGEQQALKVTTAHDLTMVRFLERGNK